MSKLVKILINDDGEKTPLGERFWHLSVERSGDPMLLCSGEFYSFGCCTNVVAKTKIVERGGITCPLCLKYIREIKAVKL